MNTLTPWFADPPVRIGVYQRDYFGSLEFSYWDGHYWRFGCKTSKEAARVQMISRFQELPWRGLLL